MNTHFAVLFLIHWAITLFAAFYVFFRKNKKYDWFYFTLVGGVMISWLFFKQECIISYFEKKMLDPNYVMGSDIQRHPSLTFYIESRLFQTAIMTMLGVLLIYNAAIMGYIYHLPNYIIYSGITIAIAYLIYFRLTSVI